MYERTVSVFVFITLCLSEALGYDHTTKQLCYSCSHVATQTDCYLLEECSRHEVCFTRRATDGSGALYFDSGCFSNKTCHLLHSLDHPVVPGKRSDFTNCYSCCDSMQHGTGCNEALCQYNPPTLQHTCFECDDVLKPEHCHRLVTCDEDEECYTQSLKNPINKETRITMGCQSKLACVELNKNPYDEDGFYCTRCCDSNYCNMDLCGLARLVKPKIIDGPRDRNVSTGDLIMLRCETNPNSNSSVTWSFISNQHSTVIPQKDVTIKPGFAIINITAGTLGQWTCSASNAVGTVVQSAYLLDVRNPIIG